VLERLLASFALASTFSDYHRAHALHGPTPKRRGGIVYVIEGEVDAWIDGHAWMVAGDLAAFPLALVSRIALSTILIAKCACWLMKLRNPVSYLLPNEPVASRDMELDRWWHDVLAHNWHRRHARLSAVRSAECRPRRSNKIRCDAAISGEPAWTILVAAGLFEVGWAIGLKYTEGFPVVADHLTVLAIISLWAGDCNEGTSSWHCLQHLGWRWSGRNRNPRNPAAG
jgi:hypothetical protein